VTDVSRTVGAITLFVEDPVRARGFYVRAFDASPLFEDADSAAVAFDNLIVNLLRVSAAGELVEPAAIAEDGGSRFMLTVWVDDADATVAELRRRGVDLLNGPMDRPWGMRTAAFADPDGHVWEIAEQLSADS
jgi:catechol 2,3-dioxygenase-like lactoylglutathione lyase family enzyme